MRAAADFEAEWLVGTIGNHFVDFYRVAVAVTKLAKRALFFNGDFGRIFRK